MGAPAAAHLASAGVGRIGIVDPAPVALSTLDSQALHVTPEVGLNRAETAALKLGILNAEVRAEPYPVRLEGMNAAAIVAGADIVLEASNHPVTRGLVNDACCAERVPLVAGGHGGLRGFALSVRPGGSACCRCALPETPGPGSDPLAEAGASRIEPQEESGPSGAVSPDGGAALGAVAGLVGAIQALEALKLLTGLGKPLLDRILRLDGTDMRTTLVESSRRQGCPACARARAPQQSQ